MDKLEHVRNLRRKATELALDGVENLWLYTEDELARMYNGIGPEAFPDWLRDLISTVNPALEVVALIHDVEWSKPDNSFKSFTASNDRFRENGYIVAKADFGWYNPMRYVVMMQARKFAKLCQQFGWLAWYKDEKIEEGVQKNEEEDDDEV